jgi:thioredoxin reductase (NADPH)
VFIAAGVGAFQHRTLPLTGIEKFTDRQVFHNPEATANFADQHVVIVGSDDAALDCAFKLCAGHDDGVPQKASSVTLIHRRDVLAVTPQRMALFQSLCDAGAMHFVVGQITGLQEVDGVLTELDVLCHDNSPIRVHLDRLVLLLGVSPKLGPLAHWGLDMERRQLQVDTESFSTSAPGVFAVGDINTYPGKKKLILCGFHEATLAAYAAAAIVFPQRRTQVQYTTTSPRLHTLLGVTRQS